MTHVVVGHLAAHLNRRKGSVYPGERNNGRGATNESVSIRWIWSRSSVCLSPLRAAKGGILPGDRVVERFQVGKNRRPRHRIGDVALDRLHQVMAPLHGPHAWYEDVHRDEAPRPRLTRPERVRLDTLLPVPVQYCLHRVAFSGR